MFNLPNSITLARIALVVVFTVALSLEMSGIRMAGISGNVIALYAFVLAAVSDWLDGYLARKLGMVTTFGKLIDPLADKILVSAAFIFLTTVDYCPFWVTALIICREFLVTGLRQIAQDKGVIMAADWTGKWKTAFQLAFCTQCLIVLAYGSGACQPFAFFTQGVSGDYTYQITLWGSILLTVWSGLHYCIQSWKFLR